MPRRPYPSDLSDAEWTLWDPLLPSVRPGGRPRAPLARDRRCQALRLADRLPMARAAR